MTTTAEPNLALLREALPVTGLLVSGVQPDQWNAPTPCEEMTVLEIVEHLTGGLEQFAGVAVGEELDPTVEPSFSGSDPPTEFDAAARTMLAAWSAPGATDKTYPMPWGETRGAMLLGFMVIEEVTHGWDIARATGQTPAYDDDLVEAALEIARNYDDVTIRVPGMFGPAVTVPDDAPVIDRLAGFLGRRP